MGYRISLITDLYGPGVYKSKVRYSIADPNPDP
jgi:hypothetical protein